MSFHSPVPVSAVKKGISFLLAFVGILLCALLLNASRQLSYHWIWIVALIVGSMAGHRFLELEDVRAKRVYGILGGLFALAQALGYRLALADRTGVDGLLLCMGIGASFAPAAGYGFSLLSRLLDRAKINHSIPDRTSPAKVFWVSFATILICWTPVFLAYYPGLFAYDVSMQISEVISGQFTNYNPLLHTLYLGGFYLLGGALGDYNTGIALAVILQMVIMAAVFAWLLRYLASIHTARVYQWVTLAVFALLPTHSMLAISCTKDTLFCGAFLLFAIRLHQLSRMPDRIRKTGWFLATLGTMTVICLLRNNAFFGILMCIPLGLLILPQALRLRLVALVLGALIAFVGISQGLQLLFHADGLNNVELVCMPSQQMARVDTLHRDEYPPSAEIEAYLPTASYYIPYSADIVKTFAEVKNPGQLWGFIKLWGKVGLRYPIEYLDAFLLTMQGYWWLDDTTHASIYGEGLETRQGYLLTDTKEGFGVTHQSLLPPLESLLEKLFSANEYQRIPILNMLFAPALYIWLAAFALARAIVGRRRDIAILWGFLFCYMIPLWLGACVLIRYAYPFVVCMPLLLFVPKEEGKAAERTVQIVSEQLTGAVARLAPFGGE